jgi:uncharacterized alkaline shock family protein YloU
MLPDQHHIRLKQERGDLTITHRALTRIVERELQDLPGVAHTGSGWGWGARLLRLLTRVPLLGWLLSRQQGGGLRVDLGEGEVGVALTIVARHGVDLHALADLIRQRISAAVRSTAGVDVRCVDVFVADVLVDHELRARRLDPSGQARQRFTFGEVPSR